MKELKINPRFKNFSPLKKQDEIECLKKSLLEKGYIGAPILIWHGFIVDGHNRYELCNELGIKIDIDKNVEEIDIGDDADEIDAMDWMLTHQLSSKNLTPGERLAMTEIFKEELKIENEKRKLEANKKFHGNQYVNSPPIGGDTKLKARETYTDNQIAKKAGVGVGTVARYNKIMNSDIDSETKEDVKTGKISVNKAYTKVRKQEIAKRNECDKGIAESHDSDSKTNQASKEAIEVRNYFKTRRKGDFNYDISIDINSVKCISEEAIETIDTSIFKNAELMKYIEYGNCDEIITYLNETKKQLEKIIEKMEELKNEKKNN